MAERRKSSHQWLVIARREFLERVRSAWFVVVTVLGPLGMIGVILVPAWLSYESSREEVGLAVVDRSGRDIGAGLSQFLETLHANFRIESVPPETAEDDLRARVRRQEINGFLILSEDLLDGGKAIYRGDNATNLALQRELFELVNFAVRKVRALDVGLTEAEAAALQQPVLVESLHTTGEGEEKSAVGSFVVGYAVMFILYMAILLYAVNVMRSVVQEKTSRVVELIVSATRPRSLMLGKILGVGGVGVFQLAIWAAVALVLIHFRGEILGLFGVGGAGSFEVPPLTVGDVALVIAFFLLGFFFYASLYAAIGAMVNSDQEAQQAQTPIMILLIIPAICVQLVANDPRGSITELLTIIPFSSPILMPMRYLLGGAGPLDVALSLSILAASIAGAVWLAARIYRVGILMYGKRPGLRELARWIRY